MKKSIIALTVGLGLAFGTSASSLTLQGPDQAFLEKAAQYGITPKNWDTGRSVRATFTNSYKFVKSHQVTPRNYTHDIGEAVGFDLDSLSASDIDGEYPLSVIMRDRLELDALVILKDGQLVDEYYWSGMARGRVHQMNSVTKSFTRIALQTLVDEGKVDMSKKVSHYIPELADNPVWSKTTVQEAADMRSGVQVNYTPGYPWDQKMTTIQEWNGPNTEYPEMTSIVQYADELGARKDVTSGEAYDYQCINTEMLGIIVTRITGKNLAENFQERLWDKVGFEYPAYLMANSDGEGMGSGGLVASTRDLARMMDVLVNEGKSRQGEQIVSNQFIQAQLEGNDDVRAAWMRSKESAFTSNAWYKDQIRTFNFEGRKFMAFVGTNGQTAIGEPATGVVIAFNGAQDEYQAPRTVAMTFLDVVPTLLEAIEKVEMKNKGS